MLNRIVLLVLLLCSPAFAGDYVCHVDGQITEKYISVDGANLDKRPECLKISREKMKALTSWSKVDAKIIGTAEDKIVEASEEEKLAVATAAKEAADEQAAQVDALKLKLKELGFTDEEISMLIGSGV